MILILLIIVLLIPTPAMAQGGDGWEWEAAPAACEWSGGCDAAGAGVITAGGDNAIIVTTCPSATTSLLIAVDDTSRGSAAVRLGDYPIENSLYIEGHAIARIPPMPTITHTLTLESVGPYTGVLHITRLEARCVQQAPTRPARSLAVDDPAFDAIQPYEFHKGTTGFTALWDFFDVLEQGREALRWMLTTLIMLGAGLDPLGMGLWIIVPLAISVGFAIIKHVTKEDTN